MGDDYKNSQDEQIKTRVLASYVPKILLKKYQLQPETLKLPTIEVISAAVVFADISGFIYNT